MNEEVLEKLKYPIGKFSSPLEFSQGDIDKWLREIEDLPSLCKTEMMDFTEEMLETPYRSEGWTARQVIHHIVDSHINAYIRFKLALTEELPSIKPYSESKWAELPDAKMGHPELSLALLDSLHKRWALLLRSMKDEDYNKKYFHPESKKEFQLRTALALYAWHGRHHLEHIRIVKRKFTNERSEKSM